MLILDRILGQASEPELAERLHQIGHVGGLELLQVSGDDVQRRRLRLTSDAGTDCAIRLARTQRLSDGAILLLDTERAIMVRTDQPQYLMVRAVDAAGALELGYFAGNMHWSVRFDTDVLAIQIKGEVQDYLDRLTPMIESGKVQVESPCVP
ncbi:urease accessory protein UreE [Salinisphaera orenii]|nr:urease accessory protein UreE [Salinisphaera orenii]